jgi:hypothetical protein
MDSIELSKRYKEEKKAEKELLKKEKILSKQKEKSQLSLSSKWKSKPKDTTKGKTTKPKKKKKPTTKKLKWILAELTLIYAKIKKTDNDWNWYCITCNKFWPRYTMQWWHFMPVSKWLSTKFELDNINLQCSWCNGRGNQWEQYKHWLYIDREFGEWRSEELIQQANKIKQWKVWELEEAIDDVEQRIVLLCKKHWQSRTALLIWYIVKDGSRKAKCKNLLSLIVEWSQQK